MTHRSDVSLNEGIPIQAATLQARDRSIVHRLARKYVHCLDYVHLAFRLLYAFVSSHLLWRCAPECPN